MTDIKTKVFACRISEADYKALKYISMKTGMTIQDIGNYVLRQEIERFDKQYPKTQFKTKIEKHDIQLTKKSIDYNKIDYKKALRLETEDIEKDIKTRKI
jgi:hypothetical protein